ncbi:hypothetical protein DFH09DRAFT_1123040 [Mycena vulgaris]|nr:hypothetical protein DFH09DRAFT_1123040 [Mycena vulgaris]
MLLQQLVRPRLALRVQFSPAHIVRTAASFPPFPPNKTPLTSDAVVDPLLFLQLRQRIIERHTPSSVELDEDHVQLVNKNIFNIRRGLDRRDIALIRTSWAELREVNHLHILGREVVEQIAQLATTSFLPDAYILEEWDSDRRSFLEEVALAAASHSTDALNACLLAYLQKGKPAAVFELYEKFKQLPDLHPTPQISDLTHTDDDIAAVTHEMNPGRANVLLAVMAAYAMENSFQSALNECLDIYVHLRRYLTPEFLRAVSHDPVVQKKVENFVERLDLAKSVARPVSLTRRVHTLSTRHTSAALEALYNSLLEAMAEPDPCIAADPTLLTSTKPVAMTEHIWASFLVAFLRRDQNQLAAKVWSDATGFGIRPGVLTWNLVFNLYSDRKASGDLRAAWGRMAAQDVKPDGFSYRALISCFFADNRFNDALRWFEIFESDAKPTSTPEATLAVYNAVLHGLLYRGAEHATTAFSLFEKMEQEGPKPDLVSFNTVMRYHGRQGNFKAMAAVLSQMAAAKVTGDVFTFSTILSALLKAGRTDAPAMVSKIMRSQGVVANVAIFTAIINSQMAKQTIRDLQAAMHLLDEMEKDPDSLPNEVTYTSILTGLYRGAWLTTDGIEMYTRDIAARMKKRKIKFQLAGYNILIKGCLLSEQPTGLEKALGYYREMVRNNVTPVDDTWYILLAGLLTRDELKLAEEIVNEMFASGARPGASVLRLVGKIRRYGTT